jgi:hypothetical protein
MLTKRQEAKECAIFDIQQELEKQRKNFVGFIHALDPIMEELVDSYENQQDIISIPRSFCISAYATDKK